MTMRTAERRVNLRMPAAHPAMLSDSQGRPVAQGRTANISQNGAMVLVNARRTITTDEKLRLELHLPALSDRPKRRQLRVVVYTCRVVHVQPVGQMLGVGIELLDKIA
ncbi:MAG: PilZ domain-containing protein [Planctomycetes bacterium]|jgi:hypothetical protein|nr:PilZ domain-containing protein [Planctomycetota bacterium]